MVKKNLLKLLGRLSEIVCEASGEKCRDELIVIKGAGKPLLGKSTAEKLKVFMKRNFLPQIFYCIGKIS